MTDTRAVLGFDVGDLVRFKARYQSHLVWEVADVDPPRRKLALRRWIPNGELVESTVSPSKVVLVQTAEERVAEALMREAK